VFHGRQPVAAELQQRGAALLQFCRDRLTAVEHQIKLLDEGTQKPWMQE
ncbi:exodeoxyribonuclease VII small subunit, partial [Ramlibacter sp.]